LVKLSTTGQKKWIAVYTRPRHEKTVEQELKNKGYETYLPILRERRKWSDRKKWVEFPMFRSYVFTRITFNQALPVLETIGVVKIIKFGNEPAVVQDEHIEGVKLMIEGGYNPQATDYFLRGDQVEVRDGPLKGLAGDVIRLDDHDRLVIRIDAIQHSVSVQIDRRFLKTLK
jgi:transcription antitermination factor NusG